MKTKLLLLLSLLVFITNCETIEKNSDYIDGALVHSVYFWLNNPENEQERAEFEMAIKKLIKTNKIAVKKGKPKYSSTVLE